MKTFLIIFILAIATVAFAEKRPTTKPTFHETVRVRQQLNIQRQLQFHDDFHRSVRGMPLRDYRPRHIKRKHLRRNYRQFTKY